MISPSLKTSVYPPSPGTVRRLLSVGAQHAVPGKHTWQLLPIYAFRLNTTSRSLLSDRG